MAFDSRKLPPKIRALVAQVEERRGQSTRMVLADGLRLNVKLEADPKDPSGGLHTNWCKLPLSAAGEIREKAYASASAQNLDKYPVHGFYVDRVGTRTTRAPTEQHVEQVLRWADIVPCYCGGCVHAIGLEADGYLVPNPNGTVVPRDVYLLRANLAIANKVDVDRRDAWKAVEAILNGTYIVPEPPAPEPVVVAEAEPVAEVVVEIVASVEPVQVVEVVEPPPDAVWSPYGIGAIVDDEFFPLTLEQRINAILAEQRLIAAVDKL